jgi:hypothetical protein
MPTSFLSRVRSYRDLNAPFMHPHGRDDRRFSLADHLAMGASLDNGLLYVDVVREVPEAAKPRTIKIGTTVEPVKPQVMEQKAA